MNVRNCRGCGRIFNYVAGPMLCQKCREELEAKFQEVKEYIRSNPGVGMSEVSAACDVPVSQIQQWLREERLEVTEDSPIFLSCEGCGTNIRSGKYCDKCKYKMTMGFKSVLDSQKPQPQPEVPDPRENARMRYL